MNKLIKNIIKTIVLMLILISNKSFAQDKYPEPFKFNYYNKGTLYNNHPLDGSLFTQDSFWLGTQWGGSARMLKALKMNGNHGTLPSGGNPAWPNPSGHKLQYIWEHKGFDFARGFQFEPTLYISDSSRGQLVTRNHQIFGFGKVLGTIEDSSTNENYDRLKLGFAQKDSIVLANSWINNQYIYHNKDTSTITNGTKWVLSINLRRIDIAQNNSGTTPILTIRLPYTKLGMSGTNYIKFDSTSTNINSNFLLTYSPDGTLIDTLGYNLQMQVINNDTTANFVIYDNMIPDYTFWNNYKRKDITINAFFTCDDPFTTPNAFLKTEHGTTGIDKLDIEVKYHGNTEIAINHLRIATQDATKFFNGTNYNAYREKTQLAFDSLYARGYEIYGMYGQDEFGEEFFSAQRYNSYLMNFQTLNEGAGGEHLDHYIEHVEPKQSWIGSMGHGPEVGAPYFWPNTIQYQNSNWIAVNGSNVYPKKKEWMEYAIGSAGNWSDLDSLKSSYETDLNQRTEPDKTAYWKSFREFKIDTNIVDTKTILNKLRTDRSTLGTYDYSNYISYFKNSSYLYYDTPWWANYLTVGNFKGKKYVYLDNTRPKTAEEARMSLWNRVIFGAKGFNYDSRVDSMEINYSDAPTIDEKSNIITGYMGNYHRSIAHDTFSEDSLIFTDNSYIGGDFIPEIDSASFIHLYVNRDTAAKYLRVPKDRIYYGRKSPRLELYKMHSFIRANDTELMNLRLQASFSKGTLVFENQHPDSASGLIDKYVSLDRRNIILVNNTAQISDIGVKTRPLGRVKSSKPHYETYDSTFFDLTIHKHKDKSMDSVFYIAALNKRTDPLIMMDSLPLDKHLLFLTDDEFGKLCRTGGKDPTRPSGLTYDSTYWQKKWWSRLGAREMVIPFDYVNSSNTNHYNLLKVEELRGEFYNGATKIANNNLPFHLQSKYYQHIDTVLGQDGNLVLNMLPGQGKILKVTVLKPDLSINGRLDHSNQSKLVAYPVLDSAGNETNKIQYHVVYFREDSSITTFPGGYPNRVYYRKSLPMAKNDPTENIKWQSEVLISNEIKSLDNSTEFANFDSIPSRSCDYPSIVVRKDGNILKAYIAYTCGPNFTANENYLILSVINTHNPVSQLTVFNKLMAVYKGRNRQWFGTPTINASAIHNYIAWSDSTIGIVSGAMLPSGSVFIDKDTILNSVFGGVPFTSSSNHPSLNTYSRMSAGEDNCALVWQHSPNTNTYYKNILYTRLKVENDTLKTYSALGNSNLTIQNNIAKVTADYGTPNSNQFPVVYRSLDSLNYNLGFPHNKTDDIIVWQNTIANYQSSNIDGRVITSRDSTSGISKSILGWMPVALQDNYRYSFLPDLAQQSGLLVGGTIKFPYGKYVMNFVRGDANGYRTFNFPATGSWVSDINVMGNNFSTINEISLQTKQPHLAKYKEINITNNIWRNRRVYEEYINNNYSAIPKIVSNGRFFYKNNVVNELEAESFVGFNKGSSKYQISLPTVNNQLVSLQLPFIPIMDSTSYINYDFDNSQDTIFSNWFDVDMVGNLNFKCYGFNDTIMKAQIQRQSDNVFFDLNLPVSTTDTTGKLGEYTLINGGLNSYRLCFSRLDTNYQYTETLVLDGLPVSDTVMLKNNGSSKQIIDLSGRFSYNHTNQDFNILISPNPVDEVVYLTPLYSNLSNKNIIEIEIFDNLGNVIAKIKTKSGESVEYDTKDLSNGVYFVKCSEFIDEWFLPTLLKTTKFIVNR